MYDRSIKVWDEPHTPVHLEKEQKKENINRGKFANPRYGFSYLTQIKTILDLGSSSVLEIGPGDDLSAHYFQSLGVTFHTMNIPGATNSTYQSKLEDFDVDSATQKYDLVAAFQMLEHSPYESFQLNLRKMANLSNEYVFISLPYDCFGFGFDVTLGRSQMPEIANLEYGFRPVERIENIDRNL